MNQSRHITLYAHSRSMFSHRVHLALEEAKADYTFYVVDIIDKSTMAWYTDTVNPTGKIPTITYGPKGDPRNPAPKTVKINESLIILEFLAEIFPETQLLPVDPVRRARARLFMNAVETKLVDAFRKLFFAYTPGAGAALLTGFEAVQALLPPSGFAVGAWSLADIAAAPILVWIHIMLEHDIRVYPAGEGLKVFEVLTGPTFARLVTYIEEVQEWPTFERTVWDKNLSIEFWKTYPRFHRE